MPILANKIDRARQFSATKFSRSRWLNDLATDRALFTAQRLDKQLAFQGRDRGADQFHALIRK